MDKQEVLRRYFGHGEFREGQETLIDALLAGRDALGIMPTGGGKSLCYQVPALLLPGVTLVISPLISLMKDQVMALEKAGAPAAFLNSSLSAMERRAVYDGLRQGAYRLLYVAPERLEAENFSALAKELTIPLVAVDEAHCISQWGQDFRPSYRRIADFLSSLPRRPAVGAFTATATDLVQRDIVALLGLRDPVRAVTGFDRPNLFFDVRQPRNKGTALLELLRQREGRSGIIYCATRATVERLCEALREHGIPATRYHAGLSEEERRQNQEDFQFDRCPVMVATNAFGMGIDKSNVSFVLHYNMPKSVEAYYQEAGRAGRDGEKADCILLYSAADVATARFLIESSSGGDLPPEKAEEVRRQDYRRLSAITGYCRSTRCLRGELLDYFGQAHAERCGNCGNCLGDFRWEDITREAQMILSCVLRVREKLGFSVGKTLIVRTLRGSRDARVLQLGLDRVSTYGLLAKVPAAQIRDLDGPSGAGGLSSGGRDPRLPGGHGQGPGHPLSGGDGVAPRPGGPAAGAEPAAEGRDHPPGGGRALRRPALGADAHRPGRGRPGLRGLLQRGPCRHGGEAAPEPVGIFGGLRRGRGEGPALRRGVSAGHPGI